MVIEFDSSVHVLTEITGDRNKIDKAIRKTGFGDGTSLYEAVDFSLRKRLDKIEGRKAIVLFTDGVDTTKLQSEFLKVRSKMRKRAQAVIFPIYYNTFLSNIGIGGGGGVMSSPPILEFAAFDGRTIRQRNIERGIHTRQSISDGTCCSDRRKSFSTQIDAGRLNERF